MHFYHFHKKANFFGETLLPGEFLFVIFSRVLFLRSLLFANRATTKKTFWDLKCLKSASVLKTFLVLFRKRFFREYFSCVLFSQNLHYLGHLQAFTDFLLAASFISKFLKKNCFIFLFCRTVRSPLKLLTLQQFYLEMVCAIWYNFYNLKNLENTHGGVILLVTILQLY